MGTLDDRKVLVIGGSAGMGYATAEAAIDEGATVAIAARNPDRLEEAARRLEERGDRPVRRASVRVEDRDAVMRFMRKRPMRPFPSKYGWM